MKSNRYWLILCSTSLVTGALLLGCAGKTKETVAPPPSASVAQEPSAADRPGAMEGEFVVINAKVTAIDKKNRIVSLKFEDGRESRVKCGPEVRNFAQIRVGDNVRAQFLETVELYVAGPEDQPSGGRTTKVKRAPLGSRPAIAAIDAVEVRATVLSIDYQTREVMLQGPEGKTMKVKAGPEVKRLDEVKQGDTVVARLTRAASITVSEPEKK